MQQRLLQKELRIQKQRERARKTEQRLQLLKFIRQEEQRLLNIKRKKRAEQTRQKCKIAAEIARRKVIDVLVDWKKKDKGREKAKNMRLIDIKQQKQKIIEERCLYAISLIHYYQIIYPSKYSQHDLAILV